MNEDRSSKLLWTNHSWSAQKYHCSFCNARLRKRLKIHQEGLKFAYSNRKKVDRRENKSLMRQKFSCKRVLSLKFKKMKFPPFWNTSLSMLLLVFNVLEAPSSFKFGTEFALLLLLPRKLTQVSWKLWYLSNKLHGIAPQKQTPS